MSNSSKLSAKDRILTLLDDNSFVEIGSRITKRNTDFNLQTKEAPSDGVITGYGTINEAPVYVYAQDAAVLNGTLGEMHAKKIDNVYDLAIKCGAPVIGLIDCGGIRLEEGADALEGLGTIMMKQTMASGVVPQIAAVFGPCGGGLAVSASMCDFVVAEKNNGKVFVNTPNAITGNNVDKCDTSAADFKAECGIVDIVAEGEEEVLNAVRELVSVIPPCNEEDAAETVFEDDLNREVPEIEGMLADTAKVLAALSDAGTFVEIKKNFAKNMVTGFIKLDNMTVGAVANRTAILDENGKVTEDLGSAITVDGARKAMNFVNFCDAFSIPVLTLTNAEGFGTCMCQEKKLAVALAKLAAAFANANVPKVNLILKKAIGSAYTIMNSKALGADMVFALEGAQVGPMNADLAAQIVTADGEDKNAKASEIAALQLSGEYAAKRGYVDSIIDAASARKNLVYAFEMLYFKDEDRPAKKHLTI